jgi:hypothetical protein
VATTVAPERRPWPVNPLVVVFVALACVHLVLHRGDDFGWLVRVELGSVMLILLPAVVLLWREDAWTSHRLILVGTVLFGLSADVRIAQELLGFLPNHAPALLAICAVVTETTLTTASYFAPLVLAMGLQKSRGRGLTDWPALAVLIAVAVTAVLLVREGASQMDVAFNFPYCGNDEMSVALGAGCPQLIDQLSILARSLSPIYGLGLLALAWVSWSAVKDREVSPGFWQLVLLAAGLLAFNFYVYSPLTGSSEGLIWYYDIVQQFSTSLSIIWTAGTLSLIGAFAIRWAENHEGSVAQLLRRVK